MKSKLMFLAAFLFVTVAFANDKKEEPKKVEKQETARLYKRANATVKKALRFHTPKPTKLA